MAEVSQQQHGLEAFLESRSPLDQPGGLVLSVQAERGYLNLRGQAGQAKFVKAVEKVSQQPLPVQPNTFSRGMYQLFWLGPDEWLLQTRAANVMQLATELRQAMVGLHYSVNDLSGGTICLELSGSGARDVLAKGCTLNLRPDQFRAGDCAQTGLGKATVLISRSDQADRFEIVVRRSFAEYMLKWLARSGAEFGIDFRTD